MSLYGSWQTASIAINEATSDAVDLGRDYEYLQVILPALTSGTVKVTVCDTSGGTYQDLGSSITTATTTGPYSTVFKLGGWQFIKIVTSVNQGAARSIKVRGMRA